MQVSVCMYEVSLITFTVPPVWQEASKSLTSSPTKSVASNASSDASPTDPSNRTLLGMAAQSAAPSESATVPAKPEEREGGFNTATAAMAAEESHSPADGSLSPATAPSPVTTPAQDTAPGGLPPPSSSSEGEPQRGETPEPAAEPSPASTPRAAETPENNGSAADSRPKFKSPLLQKLVEGKDDAGSSPGGGPRFKSPLLQNLLGKTKVGARMGLAQDHSVSTPNLSHLEPGANGQGSPRGGGHASAFGDAMSSSMTDMGRGGGADPSVKETMNRGEEKDVDTSENSSSSSSSHSSLSRLSAQTVVANGEGSGVAAPALTPRQDSGDRPEPMDISGTTESSSSAAPDVMATSAASFWSGQDSGASFGSDDFRSAAPSSALQVSFNGHGPAVTAHGQGLEDSR